MVRNIFSRNGGDVTCHRMIGDKVLAVSFYRVLVPLTGKYTASSLAFKPFAYATNSGKQVDEGKVTTSANVLTPPCE